jgi:hypothetical protein
MRFAIALIAVFVSLCGTAHADPKLFGLFWGGSYPRQQPTQYYYDNPRWAHPAVNRQEIAAFTPHSWYDQRGGGDEGAKQLIREWKANDIFQKLTTNCQDAKVVVIGPNFYHLGFADKARVMATLTHAYQLITYKPGVVYIADRENVCSGYLGTFDAINGLVLR